jgi:hypothetical protein
MKKQNQFYLTCRQVSDGKFRLILVWNGMDFIRKGFVNQAELVQFVDWSEKHGIIFEKDEKS